MPILTDNKERIITKANRCKYGRKTSNVLNQLIKLYAASDDVGQNFVFKHMKSALKTWKSI